MKKPNHIPQIETHNTPEITLLCDVKRPEYYVPALIKSSRDAYEQLQKLFDPNTFDMQEEALLMALNRRNEVLAFFRMSKGGLSGTVMDCRLMFTALLLTPSACAFILSHNHPSGNRKPSDADITITRKIKQGAALLELTLLDHLILTYDGYYSFGDEGML
jgi:DNA repair protein RadC